ncbi:hypothetical protein QJS10_CPA05g00556 [Acorus calamus]|uniref:DUF7812 domain-containing protein n=1 Tax=Acorus calamus TaxID=4465 RepID=A0AAV9ETD6_ACOCL|nr:hypothetical protein QJS10_CPA05g00556 [Acorus calamus]
MGENDKQTAGLKGTVLHGSMCTSDSAFTTSMGDLDASACASGQVSVILIISSALEVFMDELLSNQPLRKRLIVTDYVSCTREKLMSCCGNIDVGIVLEAVCAHFSLSISNVRAFNKFLQSLYWLYRRDDEIPQLRLHSALVLLSPHIMLSTPQLLQTHQVLLVSRCIGIHMSSCVGELNNYMIAFERAVDLHLRHMSSSRLGDLLFVVKGSKDSSLHFHEQYDKIDVHVNEMVGSFNMCFLDMFSGTKADMVSSPVAYIEENQCIMNGSCRNEACSVLNYFVTMILTSEIGVNVIHIEIINHAEELFMASLLKLMSCSLLQIIMFTRRDGFAGGLKALNDYSGSNEYDTLVEIISHFGEFMVKPPLQKILEETLKARPENFSGTKLMLAHTVVLLIYSLRRRLAFLWKGCIFFMMTIIDLLNLEEGNLDSLKQLHGCMDRTPISPSSVKDNQSEIHQTGASAEIAFIMQYIKKVYIKEKTACQTRSKKRMDINASEKQETGQPQFATSKNDAHMRDNMVEEATCEPSLSVGDDDFCDGEAYINCLEKSSDFDGLADFIACKPGMDYSLWLKQRKKYRKWVIDKQTGIMKRRKKTALGSFRCTRSMRARQK